MNKEPNKIQNITNDYGNDLLRELDYLLPALPSQSIPSAPLDFGMGMLEESMREQFSIQDQSLSYARACQKADEIDHLDAVGRANLKNSLKTFTKNGIEERLRKNLRP